MGFLKDLGKAFTGGLSGLIGSGLGLIGQNQTAKHNELMQNRQNEWNAEQAKLQRDWQSDESAKSRDWQESMWNKNNAYNTPEAQMRRMQQAGMNPWLTAGGAGVASTQPQGAMASGGAAAQGVSPPYQDNPSFSQSFNGIAQALASLAQAKKTGVDTSFLEKTLGDRVMSEEFKRKLAEVQYEWSGRLSERQIAKLSAEIADAWDRMDLRKNEMLTEAEQADFIHEQKNLVLAKIDLSKKEYEQMSLFLTEFFRDYYKSLIAKQKADANASNASATKSRAEAEESRSRTNLNNLDYTKQTDTVAYKTLSGKILHIPAWKAENYSKALQSSSVSESYKTTIKQLQAEAAAAEARGDFAYVHEIINTIDGILSMFTKFRIATESSDEVSSEETVKSSDGRRTVKTKHKSSVPRRRR